ncbi:hypothetical protein ARNL5_01264 [Anaerolineae bacterium]|nr:hypothetical protein ARNL5_01264 [Anaerolineae bacterium]
MKKITVQFCETLPIGPCLSAACFLFFRIKRLPNWKDFKYLLQPMAKQFEICVLFYGHPLTMMTRAIWINLLLLSQYRETIYRSWLP